jgi:hypothetical protein
MSFIIWLISSSFACSVVQSIDDFNSIYFYIYYSNNLAFYFSHNFYIYQQSSSTVYRLNSLLRLNVSNHVHSIRSHHSHAFIRFSINCWNFLSCSVVHANKAFLCVNLYKLLDISANPFINRLLYDANPKETM